MAGHRDSETEEHLPSSGTGASPLCASVFVEGRSFVVEFPPRGSVVVGRDPDSDLQLGSGSVSRQHARLDMRGDHGSLVDLASRNGTFVNGEQLGADACRVERGDEVWFGSARMGLIAGALVPSSVRVVLLRAGLFARMNERLARGEQLHVLALRLPERWFGHDDVVAWLPRLPADAYVAMLSEDLLAVVSTAPLEGPIPPGEVGRVASDAATTSADALVAAAMRALSTRRIPGGAPAPEAPLFASEAMKRARDEATKIAPSNVGVLIIGETGVGKEVFARMIHERSGRTGPLVSVNTAAMPEALVESELFGHERGAFSGAHAAKVGLIEAAQKGTLFLDEIGDLPLPLQAKLLRVLEDRSVRPVGSTQERKVDVRIIAATHTDLERAVQAGSFRQDLYFRLNACTLRIPPLRERRDEIPMLACKFLAQAVGDPSHRVLLPPATAEILHAYRWPGNVRELRNVIERGVALAGLVPALLPEHLPDHVRTPMPIRPSGQLRAVDPTADVRDALKDYERERILEALEKTGGNRTEAAKVLGLPRRTLTYKLAKLGIT
jgi:two-component system, NtrC family, response regulator AtoC